MDAMIDAVVASRAQKFETFMQREYPEVLLDKDGDDYRHPVAEVAWAAWIESCRTFHTS